MRLAEKPINPIATKKTIDDGMFGEVVDVIEGGLTYREWLIGMLASNPTICGYDKGGSLSFDDNARYVIAQAEAIIKELEKEK